MTLLNKALFVSTSVLILGYGYHIATQEKVDFNTDVKPIINKKCMSCHGGVKKAGGFSLLFEEEALGKTKSGKHAIIPGDADASEFITRLTHSDPEKFMPKKGAPLTEEEIQVLTDWVNQGAKWGTHWAYKTVEKPEVPKVAWWKFWGDDWAKTDIDQFVKVKSDEQGLSHASEADKATLLRRVTLDLTGLTPTARQYQQFLSDKSPKAYETVVDSLLNAPAFGEKWAAMWLDLARYADSKGYEKDDHRNIWRYRDWVIRAFNENMPYDQFITEQLAGDLLKNPNNQPPTESQLIATAFHRNTMNNDEGGTDDEEFRTAAVLDRVSTNWVTFGSTTFACVQCHSHPYDPFRHEEFYQFMAFFNNTRDEDVSDESAHLRFFGEEDQKKLDEVSQWVKTNVSAQKAQEVTRFLRTIEPRIYAHNFDSFKKGTSEPSSHMGMQNGGTCRLKNAPVVGKSKMLVSYSTRMKGGTIEIKMDSLGGETLAVVPLDTSRNATTKNTSPLYKWVNLPALPTRRDLHFIFRNDKLEENQDVCQVRWILFLEDDFAGKDKLGYELQRQNFEDLLWARTDNLPILLENPEELKRITRVFERGSMYSPAKAVKPGVPHSLNAFPRNSPKNRLGLAQWITSKDNPLTARTMVNRLWEQLFGTGLVETLEDMGSQGFSPTHPTLLDFLSHRFMNDYQWQIKPLLKEIVMSATYRQDSHATEEDITKDPVNRYLARGPRVRLTGEQIRDQTLVVSNLLSKKMYGKPVMPYQPEGVWQAVYSSAKWQLSQGEDAYRRAVYTYIRRSSPYPSMLTFDGSTRDMCLARRIRTNTPLQALVTLNDTAFIEMSQRFAQRMEYEGGKSKAEQIKTGYWWMTGHELPKKKEAIFLKLYQEAWVRFKKDPRKREDWMCNSTPETASLAVVANMMLNMDEFITKE